MTVLVTHLGRPIVDACMTISRRTAAAARAVLRLNKESDAARISFSSRLRLTWGVLRRLGPRWVLFRLRYAWQLRTGALRRRAPLAQWADFPPVACTPLWPAMAPFPAAAGWGNACVADACAVACGEFVLFSKHRLPLGFPPPWHRNPFSGQVAPSGAHWSALGDFDFGDIKAIWEPNRFDWAFSLVRSFARTGDPQQVETFWLLFEDWCRLNPPNAGVNWKCGQEATFRLMAASFAVAQFARAPATTPARLEQWSRFVIATGRRIAANIDYALSQSNNHGVGESVGLLTAALFAADAPESVAWRARGLRCLQTQVEALVYEDGGFSQHSLVYHRVLLHDLLWGIVLLRAAGNSVPEWLEQATRRALGFLAALVDPATGAAPLYGPNDGSNVLPLDECPYDDLRGVVQAGYAVLDGVRALADGPWNEAAYWLTGQDPAALPVRPVSRPAQWHASASGCFAWQSGDARLFMRCPTHFHHRVADADMLQVDLWWRGKPLTHDAGSYSYNTPGRFSGAFRTAAAHNVPMIANSEPLQKASRFLYLPWPHGTARWSSDHTAFSATHDAYGRRAHIERSIASPREGVFVVRDRIAVPQPTTIRLQWLLADCAWQFDPAAGTLSSVLDGVRFLLQWECSIAPRSVTMVRADEHSPRGWWSPHYLAVEPASSLELLFDVSDTLEVSMRLGPA